ncbi:uncharacterized protein LOC117298816 isoform X2 [Asterias rubens]|uniref:uncharacterized protein LOC117298816 isoform X2 n=1 Tax=Asterias rubens TaxID=7604 RepID=UPI001455DB85|nr:uncharacterized protein LOC117298816 isoform X2 [Asterias rubens]
MYGGTGYGNPGHHQQRLMSRGPGPQMAPMGPGPQVRRPLRYLPPEPRGYAEFPAIYMGSVPLGAGNGGGDPSFEDVARVVSFLRDRTEDFRRNGTRLKMYVMEVGCDRVSFKQPETRDVQHIPINLIHFVAADPRHSNIFSMVARGKGNRFVCHVFECNTPRQCGVITSTLSEAFRVGYENWIHVEENQRRLAERREMDMGGLDYFQEWDDHAPHGTPVVNIVERYNRGISCPRNFVRPQDELPVLPDRLIVTQGGREVNGEPSSMRYSFEDEEEEFDDYPVEEVYVRSGGGGRRRNQPVVYDVRPDWD